jgi:hypothetical protein
MSNNSASIRYQLEAPLYRYQKIRGASYKYRDTFIRYQTRGASMQCQNGGAFIRYQTEAPNESK